MAYDKDHGEQSSEPDSSVDAQNSAREIDTADGNLIELISANSIWKDNQLDAFEAFASRAIDHIQDFFDLPALSLSVLLDDDARIQQLNKDFRNQDKPTNVLSFPAWEDENEDQDQSQSQDEDELLFLGDIAIAFETVSAEAVAADIAFDDHLSHLFVHGALHLLGYDHEDPDEAEEMEALEIAILGTFSIANPYAGTVPINQQDAG